MTRRDTSSGLGSDYIQTGSRLKDEVIEPFSSVPNNEGGFRSIVERNGF